MSRHALCSRLAEGSDAPAASGIEIVSVGVPNGAPLTFLTFERTQKIEREIRR